MLVVVGGGVVVVGGGGPFSVLIFGRGGIHWKRLETRYVQYLLDP